MAHFDIGSVEENYAADMTRLLSELDTSTLVLSRVAPPPPPEILLDDGRRPFGSVADVAHAIAGTAGMVGGVDLANASRLLEQLAEQGLSRLADLRREQQQLAQIARLCRDSVAVIREAVRLELGRDRGAVKDTVEAWCLAAQNGLGGKMLEHSSPDEADSVDESLASNEFSFDETEERQEAEAEFSFEEESYAPASTEAPALTSAPGSSRAGSDASPLGSEPTSDAERKLDAVFSENPELLELFREESRELLSPIMDGEGRLRSQALTFAELKRLERTFHTLKGAAATVGLTAAAEIAAGLQARCEAVLEGSVPLGNDFAHEIEEALARLSSVTGQKPKPSSKVQLDTESPGFEAFQQELRASVREARDVLPTIATRDGHQAAEKLQRIFHRLKGSALIVGLTSVSEEASVLQERCGLDPAPTAGEIDAGIERLLRAARRMTGQDVDRVKVQIAGDKDLWAAFCQESQELLERADALLLRCEHESLVSVAPELMRTYHTLKGAANSVGLLPTGKLLHLVEDQLDEIIAKKKVERSERLISTLLVVQKEVRAHLEQAPAGSLVNRIEEIRTMFRSDGKSQTFDHRMRDSVRSSVYSDRSNGASYQESADASHASQRLSLSQSEIQSESHGASHGASHDGSRDLTDHSRGDGPGEKRGRRRSAPKAFVRVSAERLDLLMNMAGELVVGRSRLTARLSSLTTLHRELDLSRQRLVDRVEGFRRHNEFSLRQKRKRSLVSFAKNLSPASAVSMMSNTVSMGDTVAANTAVDTPAGGLGQRFSDIEFDRYDELNLLARGLAELSSDLSELGNSFSGQLFGMREDAESIGGMVSDIQGEVTRLRMVPLEQLFTRLQLPVREAAEREGKLVRVVTSGAEVTVDKMVGEALFAPMLHLVRNAVAHGIEAPETRSAKGKDVVGNLRMAARQQNQEIVIEVSDDGAGLDLLGLHRRGVTMGLIAPETPVDSEEVRRLVFAAGVSTKAEAGDVAGRGVGGDAVLQTIERLNGTVRVESTANLGTVFTLQLPLTLAITRSLLVHAAGASYAVPLFFVERILPGDEVALVESLGSTRVAYNEGYLTMRPLSAILGGGRAKPSSQSPVLVLRSGSALFAVQVDHVIGQEEIVVKNLGELLRNHPYLSGFTVRGDAELALILDVGGLARIVEGRTGIAASPILRAKTIGASEPTAVELGQIDAEASAGNATKATKAAKAEKVRALFVDDSISVRKVAERALEECGVDVTLAVDGVEAIEKLRTMSFDIIFTDLEMPRMHGYELLKELRFVPGYDQTPVVVVSSRSSQKHQLEALESGAAEFMTKPFSRDGLEAAIQRHVVRASRRRG